MQTLNIELKGKEYVIKQSFRSYLLFEEMTKKQISEIQSFKDIITLLYCTLKGCNKTFDYSFDDFIDIIDENPEVFEKFNEFNSSLVSNSDEKKSQKKD